RGVEISDTAVDHARRDLGLDVFKGNISEACFEAGYFDVATLWNVLDQIYDPRSNLIELNRILKKGGYIFMRMPNLDFHLMLYKPYLLLRFLPSCPAVFHLYSFNKYSIRCLLESTGFYNVIVKTEPIGYKVPHFVQIVGDKREKPIRKLFDMGAYIIDILTFGQIIISPSIFVIARKR
ncbi:MAG: methyltransferase domain-containing protein, partial [Candidatus Omnitrophota bacterium]